MELFKHYQNEFLNSLRLANKEIAKIHFKDDSDLNVDFHVENSDRSLQHLENALRNLKPEYQQ
jgi:hypothetical protein